ncbi:ABC transporter substrate-binding protein [Dactylosporangium sp. AC04546]|uniref:ABC transporter substrate-binding protein n=1 Tax=Dactylosporangium sp. AC04546 TaxID=2862460 RepID=UPI001EE00CCE|nr:ABC transporter substrate-binding protein [Dactylosporangium sp. AC04546]WVK79096.1 ABC transporter substrate-binding protein [Dactylosporangium sp. AC04546]
MYRIIRTSLAVLLLSACAAEPAGDPAGTVTITFSSYNYGTQGAAGTGTQALLDRFAAVHPEITVRPEAVPVADVLTKTKAAVAAGDAPDVVQIGYSKLAEAFQTLPTRSLESIAGAEWRPHVEGITPGPVETGRYQGAVHALPYTISIPTMFYNADLFRAAGLDPADPPDTMDEVRAAAQAITRAGHHGVYFGIVDSSKSDYLTQSVLNSAGGGLLDGAGKVAIDSPEAVAGIRQIQRLTTDKLQPAVATEDALAAFSAGQLGMLVVSTAVLGNLQAAAKGKFELRSAAFPSFGAGPARPTHSGAALIVLSSDPAKQRAAWQFVKFLTGDEGYSLITTKIGYLPLRAQLVTGALAEHLRQNPLLVPTIRQLDAMRPYRSFPGPRANQATVLLQDDAIAPVVLRGADADATLHKVAERIRDLVGR